MSYQFATPPSLSNLTLDSNEIGRLTIINDLTREQVEKINEQVCALQQKGVSPQVIYDTLFSLNRRRTHRVLSKVYA